MSSQPSAAPTPPSPRNPSRRVPLVMALGAAGLIGLLLVLFLTSPERRRQATLVKCQNNVKQLCLVFQSHERRAQRSFPPQFSGSPPRSWRVAMLPWLGNENLFQKYDSRLEWNEGANLSLGEFPIPQYLCPAQITAQPPHQPVYADYFLPVGKDAAFDGERTPRLADFNDGSSNTAIFVESCNQKIVWTEPHDLSVDEGAMRVDGPDSDPSDSDAMYSSPHLAGAVIGMADGSVRVIGPDVDPEILRSVLLPRDVASSTPCEF